MRVCIVTYVLFTTVFACACKKNRDQEQIEELKAQAEASKLNAETARLEASRARVEAEKAKLSEQHARGYATTARQYAEQAKSRAAAQETREEGKRPVSVWVIAVGAFDDKSEAEAMAARMRAKGFGSNVLWIPSYSSLSGVQQWLTYTGALAYAERDEAEKYLRRVRDHVPDAYGIKLDQSGTRETIE
jgi:hypothetical protein